MKIELTGDNPALPTQAALGWTVTLSRTDAVTDGDTYQWLFNGSALSNASTTSSLVLSNVSVANSGNYTLRVYHATGKSEDSNTLPLNVSAIPAGPVDLTFSPQFPSGFGSVSAGIWNTFRGSSADGSLVFCDGPNAVRLRKDGGLAAQFALPSSTVYGRVLAVLPSGSIIVSQPPYRLDSSQNPVPLTLPSGFKSEPLTAALRVEDGSFLIAQNERLARFKSDGSHDPTFAYLDAEKAVIYKLIADTNGRTLVQAEVEQKDYYRSGLRVHRLLADGSLDPEFNQVALSDIILFSNIWPMDNGNYLSLQRGEILLLGPDGKPKPEWRPFPARSATYQPSGDIYAYVEPNGPIPASSPRLVRYKFHDWGLELDRTFYAGAPRKAGARSEIANLDWASASELIVSGDFDSWDDHPVPGVVRLRTDIAVNVAPSAACDSNNFYPHLGDVAIQTCRITSTSGAGPYSYEWFALDGQSLPADHTSETLVIPSFSPAYFGRYQARISNAAGSTLSVPVWIRENSWPMLLVNISGRAMSGTGEDTVIAGVVGLEGGISTLVRGVGPGLEQFGLKNFLPNPAIDVFDEKGIIRANNDQWWLDSRITAVGSMVGAFPLTKGVDDAALLSGAGTLPTTVHLKSQDGRQGVGLLEIYQTEPSEWNGGPTIGNLSLRARTGSGEQTAIAGFVLVDPMNFGRKARVLLRAIGPSLAPRGITHPLANPVLTVFDKQGHVIAQNDDWASNNSANAASFTAVMKQVGAFDLSVNSKDAALLLDLPAGAYTMHATGGEGVVLLEIYLVR